MIRLDRVHGGNPADGVLDFSASINPLGPPRAALDAYHAAVVNIASYPPAYSRRLVAALAGWMGVETESRSRRQRYYPAYLPARTCPEAPITGDSNSDV